MFIDLTHIKPRLLYWCEADKNYQRIMDGKYCFYEHDNGKGKMRKRLLYVCPACPVEGNGWLDRTEFLEHRHED